MPHKLLLVTAQASSVRSGVGTYARMLIEGYAERGLPVTVATWTQEMDPEGLPGIEWLDLGSRPRTDPTQDSFWTLGKRIVKAFGRMEALPTHVHFLDARAAHAFVRSPHRRGVRLLGTLHDDYAAHCPKHPFAYFGNAMDPIRRWAFYRWLSRIEKRCFARFDLLLANSRATASSLSQAYGIPESRMVISPLTVGPGPLDVRPRELEGSPALLFSGGNFYRKGLDTVVRAMALLDESHPDLQLHVAGKDKAQGRIRALAMQLGVAERVHFHGRLDPDRMASLFAGADMFVMPSRTEALGLVYLEAFRAGLPVIAAAMGGVVEIVKDHNTGLLVPPCDEQALAGAIRSLAENHDLAQQMVKGGRTLLTARSPENLVKETLIAYGEDWVAVAAVRDQLETSSAGAESEVQVSEVSSIFGAHQESPVINSIPMRSRDPMASGENIRS
jgi:glycosyltransferase involved in cell wall biosynthesis